MFLKDFFAMAAPFALPRSDIYDAAAFIAGKSYEETKSSSPNVSLDDDKVRSVIAGWQQGEPTAYITGRKEFYGREFKVTPATLIPRPETETLVIVALGELNGKGGRILDLCTGSGCIILSVIAENGNASGIGVDISRDALEVAKENSIALSVSGRVEFIQGDVCHFHSDELFDIILCNPPYVAERAYEGLEKQVKFEPKIALTAQDEGLFFYKNILSKIRLLCKTSGVVFFEVGFDQAEQVAEIASEFKMQATALDDLAGIKRVVKVRF